MTSWKIVAIILIATTLLIIIGVYNNSVINTYSEPKINLDLESVSKKLNIKLNKEEFDKIKIPDNMVLYYFPEECPEYTKEMYMRIKLETFEKYFIPEKHTLIIIEKDHKWINEPTGFALWQRQHNL